MYKKDDKKKEEEEKKKSFTPATSIENALKETKNYILNIQPIISTMSLNNLNAINSALHYIYNNVCKFKSIENIKKSRMDYLAAANGRLLVIGSMFNYDDQKCREEFDKEITNWKAENEKAIEQIEKSNYYTNRQKLNKIKQRQENIKYKRFGVYSKPENLIKETIIHELGHVIAYQAMEKDREVHWLITANLSKARATEDIYKISKYANKNYQEFFAECFLQYNIGEEQPDYIKNMVETVIKKL